MPSPLESLGVGSPIVAAPMAGGPSTPALVEAAAAAGGIGFLAGGYKSLPQLAEQIAAVRATNLLFGVNLFFPNPLPVDLDAFHEYARVIQPDADAYGIELAAEVPVEDDDLWPYKLDLLVRDPVPVVSFTFGVPKPRDVLALRQAGSVVIQTVTTGDEAKQATAAGVDMVIVQAAAAGGHSGTFTPPRMPTPIPILELIGDIKLATSLPLIVAGGLATAPDVAGVLGAGAAAAMVGTVLLRSPESGASAPHKAALASAATNRTVLTRAFTGRPARGLRNTFIEHHDKVAPYGYPAIHHLTSPIRRAATAAGDLELINLWAGTGYRHAEDEPAEQTLRRLVADVAT
jgi:nitronate monooxygenase